MRKEVGVYPIGELGHHFYDASQALVKDQYIDRHIKKFPRLLAMLDWPAGTEEYALFFE